MTLKIIVRQIVELYCLVQVILYCLVNLREVSVTALYLMLTYKEVLPIPPLRRVNLNLTWKLPISLNVSQIHGFYFLCVIALKRCQIINFQHFPFFFCELMFGRVGEGLCENKLALRCWPIIGLVGRWWLMIDVRGPISVTRGMLVMTYCEALFRTLTPRCT